MSFFYVVTGQYDGLALAQMQQEWLVPTNRTVETTNITQGNTRSENDKSHRTGDMTVQGQCCITHKAKDKWKHYFLERGKLKLGLFRRIPLTYSAKTEAHASSVLMISQALVSLHE